jgi:hypothetical protein
VSAGSGTMSAEQQQMLRQKVLSGSRSPDEWIELLAPLAEYDRDLEARRKRIGKRLGWVIGLGILLAFVAVFVQPIVAGVVAVATIVAALVMYPAYSSAKKMDLADAPLGFALPLVPILREDADPGKPLDLKLDLRGGLVPAKRTGESKPYEKGAYHKVVDTVYEDPWIVGHAEFADGATLDWTVTDHILSSKKTKRNPRGKIKTKTKRKKKTNFDVTMAFPAKNYVPAPQALGAAPSGGELRKDTLKPGDGRTTVRVSRVVKSTDVDAPPEVSHLLDLVAHAYNRVAPARRKKL